MRHSQARAAPRIPGTPIPAPLGPAHRMWGTPNWDLWPGNWGIACDHADQIIIKCCVYLADQCMLVEHSLGMEAIN